MNKKTVAQKRGDDIRSAADNLKKIRLKLQRKTIPDTAHLSDLLVVKKNNQGGNTIELNTKKLKTWSSEVAQQTGKISGVSVLWLLEYLTRGLNTVLVDNYLIRNMEQVSQKNAATKFIKKHPWIESYLLYFMAMGTIAFSGGNLILNELDNDKEKNQDKHEVVVQNKEKSVLKKINPNDKDFVQKATDEYWAHIAVGLTELETYRDISKQHGNENRETNGLGCTWYYRYDDNGKLHRYENRLGDTKRWSKDYNYNQARRHLLFETMPALQRAIKDKPNINVQQMIALACAGYQRPADIKPIASKISIAKNKQQVADAFMVYNGADKWRVGTLKRRWWCAMYAVGAITAEDFLNLPRDAFSKIELNRVYQNGHFLMTDDVIKYALDVAKTGHKSTVEHFLKGFEVGREVLQTVKNTDNKTISFNDAIKQIRQKNARGDLLLYGTERNVGLV